jgi:hypothetical protein
MAIAHRQVWRSGEPARTFDRVDFSPGHLSAVLVRAAFIGRTRGPKIDFWTLQDGPKIDFGPFKMDQKLTLDPSKWTKN